MLGVVSCCLGLFGMSCFCLFGFVLGFFSGLVWVVLGLFGLCLFGMVWVCLGLYRFWGRYVFILLGFSSVCFGLFGLFWVVLSWLGLVLVDFCWFWFVRVGFGSLGLLGVVWGR